MDKFELKHAAKYSLLDSSSTEQWTIRIDEGDFKDVVYKYNTVKILDETDSNGNGKMQFTYDIIYDAEMGEHLKTVEFVNTIGDILFNMIVEQLNVEETRK